MNDFLRNTVEIPAELLVQIDSLMSSVAHRGLDQGDREELTRLARELRAIYNPPKFKVRTVNVWFFGCMERSGHYLFDQKGNRVRSMDYRPPGCPWKQIDGPLMPEIDRHGNAAIHHKDDWTAIDISDRSVDSRPRSHSLFIFDANVSFSEGMMAAETFFPDIVKRIGKIHAVDEYAGS